MTGDLIIVAVDASKEISDYVLEWALQNTAKLMDSLILLALLPSRGGRPPTDDINRKTCSLSRRFTGLRKRRCPISSTDSGPIKAVEQQDVSRRINDVCVYMLRQLCLTQNRQVHAEVKVVGNAELGFVAAEARKLEAAWVILDRCLTKEGDYCLKQLNCNIVMVDHAIPNVLRAVGPLSGNKKIGKSAGRTHSVVADIPGSVPAPRAGEINIAVTGSRLSIETSRAPSFSFSDSENDELSHWTSFSTNKSESRSPIVHLNLDNAYQRVDILQETCSPSSPSHIPPRSINKASSFNIADFQQRSSATTMDGKIKNHNRILKTDTMELERISSIRRAMPVSIKNPPKLPRLCSLCKGNAFALGKGARKFSYKEIQRATNRFSINNLLGEGGFGFVYKGMLPDGQPVAVKKHKTFSAQGALEFCSEVEILSCAQHRNLVLLVGYCIEKEWLLVYEFVCSGSLDKHLYGEVTDEVMAWDNRMKVARGAARGLRYLHEDCRVGCIIHRDVRPNNILLTHDFEPRVGDFGLARWQADGQLAEETRVVGAFGYLAPEYMQTGLVTEKADVYAFGVVLFELLCGVKATEFLKHTGQHVALVDWVCSSLKNKMINEIVDPRLNQKFEESEAECLMLAASLCLSRNPDKRPRMSKVLKILEGDVQSDMAYNNHEQEMLTSCPKQHVVAAGTTVKDLCESQLKLSEEYQAYLWESLDKFIHNLNMQ